jgi:hypothetical protein
VSEVSSSSPSVSVVSTSPTDRLRCNRIDRLLPDNGLGDDSFRIMAILIFATKSRADQSSLLWLLRHSAQLGYGRLGRSPSSSGEESPSELATGEPSSTPDLAACQARHNSPVCVGLGKGNYRINRGT